jgi:hypothetical protein
MDDADLTASGVTIEMNCSSARIRDVDVANTDSAPQFNRMMNEFCGRSAEFVVPHCLRLQCCANRVALG